MENERNIADSAISQVARKFNSIPTKDLPQGIKMASEMEKIIEEKQGEQERKNIQAALFHNKQLQR